jgi:Holliday junction resolvase
MAGWEARKAIGDQHEQRVIRELRCRGWEVHPFGQGTYPPAIQAALSQTNSPLRHLPDMIAARRQEVVTIDAKTSIRSTSSGRYAVSRGCVMAGLQFAAIYAPVPLLYVFGDLSVLTPAEVAHYSCHGHLQPTGSYYLVSTFQAHRFDDVFGSKTTSAHTGPVAKSNRPEVKDQVDRAFTGRVTRPEVA